MSMWSRSGEVVLYDTGRGGGDGGELLTLVPKRSLCGGGLLFCPAALESLRPGGVESPHTTLVI